MNVSHFMILSLGYKLLSKIVDNYEKRNVSKYFILGNYDNFHFIPPKSTAYRRDGT